MIDLSDPGGRTLRVNAMNGVVANVADGCLCQAGIAVPAAHVQADESFSHSSSQLVSHIHDIKIAAYSIVCVSTNPANHVIMLQLQKILLLVTKSYIFV